MYLIADGLTKDYGSFRALDALTVEVKPGEIVGLLGPNGSGKSNIVDVVRWVLAIVLMLAGCNDGEPSYQGWIEANQIFVGPDEAGRVEQLSVREGDHIEKGAPLFKVDSDLQQADVASLKATLLNAQQTYQQALLNVVQARANRLADTAALYQALGGGWWNRPNADPERPATIADFFQ